MRPLDLLFHTPVRDRLTATSSPGGHTRAPYEIAADRRIHRALRLFHPAMDQRDIGLLDLAPRELLGQSSVRDICFGHQHQPAGFFVKTMNDSRPQFAADL